MKRSPDRLQGFSLIEALITLAIVGIILGISVAEYSSWLTRTRVDEVANSLQRTLTVSRSEALKHGGRVCLCASDTGVSCNGTFASGWLVFHDRNRSSQLDDDERIISYYPVDNENLEIAVTDSRDSGVISAIHVNHRGYLDAPLTASVQYAGYSSSFSVNRPGQTQ